LNVTGVVPEATGAVVERYMYAAYGEATVLDEDWDPVQGNESAVANDRLFTGSALDSDTGLYSSRVRDTYHPTLGRWLERDPAGYVEGMNLYPYVSSNPVALTDPMGLCGGTAPTPDEEEARYQEYLAEQTASTEDQEMQRYEEYVAEQAGQAAEAGAYLGPVLRAPTGNEVPMAPQGASALPQWLLQLDAAGSWAPWLPGFMGNGNPLHQVVQGERAIREFSNYVMEAQWETGPCSLLEAVPRAAFTYLVDVIGGIIPGKPFMLAENESQKHYDGPYFGGPYFTETTGTEKSMLRAEGTVQVALAVVMAGAAEYAAAAAGKIPQVAANRIAGNAFRDEIAGALRAEGRGVATEVYKRTPFGKRVIDIEVSQDGRVLGGIETKVGSSRYTPLQRLKDAWLRLVENYPVNVVRDH